MKYIKYIFLFIFLIGVTTQANNDLTFEISTSTVRQHSKIKCLLLVIGTPDYLEKIAKIIQFDLEFSDQIEVEVKRHASFLDTKTLQNLYKQGTSLCLYLQNQVPDQPKEAHYSVQITLKDTASNTELFNKSFSYSPQSLIYQGHQISDELIFVLTGTKGPALSTLAYCKQTSPRQKVVCIADYACMFEKTLVGARTINTAPCWHSRAPILFYSQFTNFNSRLMSYNLNTKKQNIICSYDGLNMQPSFSPDGSKAVLCLSGCGNAELYLYDQIVCKKLKRRIFQQLTNNKGNNVSPCYLPNGNIVFCSDFQTGFPQIYLLDHTTKKTRRLTNGRGYCAAPSYCASHNSLVYTRYIKGIFQLFTLNLNDQKPREKQLTFAQGDKHEAIWSECGKYVAFTYGQKDEVGHLVNQIAVLNIPSGKIKVLTKGKEHKSFPAWSNTTFYQM